MAGVVAFTVQFTSTDPLAPGTNSSWIMQSIGDTASVAVTAIPRNVAAVLAVENLRTTRGHDAFGDPLVRRVLCDVRNVGSSLSTVTSYVVNYSVMTP
jgi:hypothetical protein